MDIKNTPCIFRIILRPKKKEENPVCKKKGLKIVKTVFRVIFVKKIKKLLGSGPFSRDGRVTGTKHIFLLGLMK